MSKKTVVPKKPRAKSVDAQVTDAFSNAAARLGAGTASLPNATEYVMERISLNYWLLLTLYRNHWISRRIVDGPAEDSLRAWPKLQCEMLPEDMKRVDRAVDRTGTQANLMTTLKRARLFGGAGALMVIKGHENILEEPLDLDDVRPGAYRGLITFDRWSGITPGAETCVDLDYPLNFGLPEYYEIRSADSAQSFKVHHSRILRFTGPDVPPPEFQAMSRWGISVLEVVYDELRKRDNASFSILNLMFRAQILAMRDPELKQKLSGLGMSIAAQQAFAQQLQALNELLSNQSLLLMGKDAGLESHQYSFSGLDGLYQQFQLDISGAAEYPMTRLFGRTMTGLGQSNDGDERIYEERIATRQHTDLKPQIDKLLPVVCMSELGEVPDDLDYIFPSVRVLTEEEKSNLAKSNTDAVISVFNAGVISPRMVLKELQQASATTGVFTNITDEDVDAASDEVQPMGELPGGMPGMGGEEPSTEVEREDGPEASDEAVEELHDVVRAADEDRPSGQVIEIGGLRVQVENPVGSTRHGVASDGKKWAVKFRHPYGYINGVRGADGDSLDCFVGPDRDSDRVFIIEQKNPDTGGFDEHKVMLGYRDAKAAHDAYWTHYDRPGRYYADMEEVPLAEFTKQVHRKAALDAEFEESKHPRKDNGQFGSGGSSSAKLTAENVLATKTGGQSGSNPGGFYKGKDGQLRYVKFYKTPAQGHSEALANTLYNDLAIGAPESGVFKTDKGEAYASNVIEGGSTLQKTGLTPEKAKAVLHGFAADVLMANWDAVGTGLDNILIKDGEAIRIDNGSAFLFRAQGTPKPASLLTKATELEGFFDPSINPYYAKVAKAAGVSSAKTVPGLRQQVQSITALEKQAGGWEGYLREKAPYLGAAERGQIAEMLTARTKALQQLATSGVTRVTDADLAELSQVVDAAAFAELARVMDAADFEETKHPRKKDGKFAPKGGGESSSGNSNLSPSGTKYAFSGGGYINKEGHKTAGSFVLEAMKSGEFTKAQVAEAASAFFGTKTNVASVNWYLGNAKKQTPEYKAAKAAKLKANNEKIAAAGTFEILATALHAELQEAKEKEGIVDKKYSVMLKIYDKDTGKNFFLKLNGVPGNTQEMINLVAKQKMTGMSNLQLEWAAEYNPTKPAPAGEVKESTISKAEAQGLTDNLNAEKAATFQTAQEEQLAAKKVAEMTGATPGISTVHTKPLTATQISALQEYTDGGYDGLNRCLRKGEPLENYYSKLAFEVDAAMKSSSISKDGYIYRGIAKPETIFGPEIKVGSTVLDNGYLSTSKAYARALGFAGSSGLVMRIKVSKGDRGIDVSGFSAFKVEQEVVLPRGSLFKITKVVGKVVEVEYAG